MQNVGFWNITFLASINSYTDIVRDNNTGQIMLRRESAAETYPVMRTMTQVRHRNLMTVFDAITVNGKCISLCEFINGTTLEGCVERFGTYPEAGAKNIICQICDGLTELHANGIVHRDIKPSNVMIENNGTVKIIDYDISRTVKQAQPKDTRILGTAGYASPEQFGFSQTNAKADIYACGVLLNYLLTGRLPNEQLYGGYLAEIIRECTQMDESKRFDSADELKMVLLGKKRSKHKKRRALPGYRGGVPLMVFTTIILLIWASLVYSFGVFLATNAVEHPDLFWGQLVICEDVLIFWSFLPYLFFGDAFTLSNIINRKNPQKGLFIMRMLGVASIAIGFVLLIIALNISVS